MEDHNYDCGYDYDRDRRVRRPQRIGANAEAAAEGRFPPWSAEETTELLSIRAELDGSFAEIKHNRLLWISVAGRMKAKGFNRSDEQCKCKWKNLVTRYKGCETMEHKALKQQFPFYNDLHAIFTARTMQKNWWIEAKDRSRGSKRKATEQCSDPNDGGEEGQDEDKAFNSTRTMTKKTIRKAGKCRREDAKESSLKEILKGFVKREMEMERQWREAFRVREEERRLKEMEWRMNMEALERERMMMEIMWREKEEERREREEARAHNRDALISALFKRLIR